MPCPIVIFAVILRVCTAFSFSAPPSASMCLASTSSTVWAIAAGTMTRVSATASNPLRNMLDLQLGEHCRRRWYPHDRAVGCAAMESDWVPTLQLR